MQIFIDSAKLHEIKEAKDAGILDGVTTNPSLMKKAIEEMKGTIDMKGYINQILKTSRGTRVSLEVFGKDYKSMVAQGKKLYRTFNPVAKNVYIKIPVNPSFTEEEPTQVDGIKAIKTLSNAGIPINTTLIFTPEQALLAAKAGARIVSPFAGRIDDYIRQQHGLDFDKTDYFPSYGWQDKGDVWNDNGIISGVHLVEQIVNIFDRYDIKTEVLAASIRNVRQMRECALVGAHIATLPFDVIKQILLHHKTREGQKKFLGDVVPEYERLVG